NFLPTVTPSSPNIVLIKNGEWVKLMERHQIEGKSAGQIADELAEAYCKDCSNKNSEETIAEMRTNFMNRFNVDPLGVQS
ncbi:MAG: BrxA/BrxB family bacilliredoxin, partial [Ginsengibacter sp.]